MTQRLRLSIAVASAIAIFLIFFGGVFFPFPRIFVLELFQQATVGTVDQAQRSAAQPEQPTPVQEAQERLGGLVVVQDLVEGTGLEATEGTTVAVGYVGVFEDAETGETVEFDRNTDRSAPFVFPLGAGQVVPGFEAGILGMREKGIRILTIQPEAAYGSQQVGPIPPNTTLQFLVELYEVRQ